MEEKVHIPPPPAALRKNPEPAMQVEETEENNAEEIELEEPFAVERASFGETLEEVEPSKDDQVYSMDVLITENDGNETNEGLAGIRPVVFENISEKNAKKKSKQIDPESGKKKKKRAKKTKSYENAQTSGKSEKKNRGLWVSVTGFIVAIAAVGVCVYLLIKG